MHDLTPQTVPHGVWITNDRQTELLYASYERAADIRLIVEMRNALPALLLQLEIERAKARFWQLTTELLKGAAVPWLSRAEGQSRAEMNQERDTIKARLDELGQEP